MVYVCGFDQGIYAKSFRDCVYSGYLSQYLYVKKLTTINANIKIIYVNTNIKTKIAVSRYDFVKSRLAFKLAKLSHFAQITPKFIINENGSPINPKGKFHTWGVNVFRRLKIIDTCTPIDLKKDLLTAESQNSYDMQKLADSIPTLKPLFIQYRRSFLVDKFLKSLLLLVSH